MGERGERREGVERTRLQRLLRPFGEKLDVGKALGRGEGGARIDDRHVEAGEPRHRRERLADVDRADDDEPRRRHLHGEERAAVLQHAGARRAKPLLQLRGERILLPPPRRGRAAPRRSPCR